MECQEPVQGRFTYSSSCIKFSKLITDHIRSTYLCNLVRRVHGYDGVGELQRLMGRPTFVENCVVEVLGNSLRNT